MKPERFSVLLVLLEIPLIVILVCQALYKLFPVWVYFLVSALLGIVISIFLLTQGHRRGFIFLQLLLIAFLIRNIWYLSTHYSVMPLGDAYGQFGVMEAILQRNRAIVLPEPYQISMYSGWPAMQLLGVSFSYICDIEPLIVAVLFPHLFFLGIFIFAYLLLRKFEADFGVSYKVTGFALIALVVLPFLFIPPTFKYQEMATLLLLATFYLLYRQFSLSSAPNSVLLIITLTALVVTHHYTSAIGLLYLFLFSIFLTIGTSKLFVSKTQHGFFRITQPVYSFFNVGIIMSIFLFLWWNNYAIIIWPYVASEIERLVYVFRELRFEPFYPLVQYPDFLTPPWALVLLTMRNIILFTSIVLGFILIWLKKVPPRPKAFVLSSLIAAGLLFAGECFTHWILSYRTVFLFSPFVVFCFGIFYERLFEIKWKAISYVVITITIALLVFCGFTGQGNHRFIPAHLYDPKVTWIQAGEHPHNWERLKPFFAKEPYNSVEQILTDNRFVLSLLLPLDKWDKIPHFRKQRVELSVPSLIVAFRDLCTWSYIGGPPVAGYGELELSEFRQEVDRRLHLIYNDGGFKVWRG
ncbi:hypothetical protein M1N84_02755 [Dehalococcoidia bacterium]|nr:hypothetical protein [Dehalococcoidia bacterium]